MSEPQGQDAPPKNIFEDMYQRGRAAGIRRAVQWLHHRADTMNDPKAREILNSAAAALGEAFPLQSLGDDR